MAIEITEYERVLEGDIETWPRRVRAKRLPPRRYIVEWVNGKETSRWENVPEERWVVLCINGPAYIWAPQTQQWALAYQYKDSFVFGMTKDEALKLLETVEPASS